MKDFTETHTKLHSTALRAPKSSGVYLWKDETGEIIYVGKAKNLKNRLSSYFSGQKDVKTRILVSRAASIEYITTDNEYEALLLENNLIKQHAPRYNINLKDGKSYPVIRITNEPFPRLLRTRRMVQDGSRYFGPFPNVAALDIFLADIYRRYPIRHCKVFRDRRKSGRPKADQPQAGAPCIYYHIGRCAAPCCGKITQESYIEYIDEISRLLEGDIQERLKKLREEMDEAAAALRFERAAHLRDSIHALQSLMEQNTVEDFDPEGRDYIAYASEGPLVSFAVLRMREGRLTGRDIYRTRSLNNEEELLPEFLMAYYGEAGGHSGGHSAPPRIYVPSEKGLSLTVQWFNRSLGIYPSISTPGSTPGEKRHEASIDMARLNAREDIARRVRERGDMPALEELRSILNLPTLPVRIEGFDIAHLDGKFPVASLISFYNGNPDKKNYRYFRLKTTDGIIDDFASMREAASRRYTRLLNEQADLPDLILIDGGIGQVNAVQGVLDALSLDIPIVGLAERNEELYVPGNSTPRRLPRRSDALRLLQRIRDETHRFATSRNQRLRTKEVTTSVFEGIRGIGKARALKLIEAYGTPERLLASEGGGRTAQKHNVAALLGCGAEQAAAILASVAELCAAAELRSEARNEKLRSGGQSPKTDESKIADLVRLASSAGFSEAAEQEPEYGAAPKL